MLDQNIFTRFLSNDIIPSLFIFDKDLQLASTTEVLPSTLHNPTILRSYEEDAKRWIVK